MFYDRSQGTGHQDTGRGGGGLRVPTGGVYGRGLCPCRIFFIFMLPLDQTARRKRLNLCAFICYQTFEHDILKTNKPILIQIGTNGPRSKWMKRSTLGVRRSKVIVSRGRSYGHHIWLPCVEYSFSSFCFNLKTVCLLHSEVYGQRLQAVWQSLNP